MVALNYSTESVSEQEHKVSLLDGAATTVGRFCPNVQAVLLPSLSYGVVMFLLKGHKHKRLTYLGFTTILLIFITSLYNITRLFTYRLLDEVTVITQDDQVLSDDQCLVPLYEVLFKFFFILIVLLTTTVSYVMFYITHYLEAGKNIMKTLSLVLSLLILFLTVTSSGNHNLASLYHNSRLIVFKLHKVTELLRDVRVVFYMAFFIAPSAFSAIVSTFFLAIVRFGERNIVNFKDILFTSLRYLATTIASMMISLYFMYSYNVFSLSSLYLSQQYYLLHPNQ